jgi:hypothetical protein
MALPSTIQNPTRNELISSSILRKDEWLPLQPSSTSQAGTKKSTPEKVPTTQILNFELDYPVSDRMLIQNGKFKAWFYPSRGLNVLFKRAGPKHDGIKSIT